MQLKMDEKNLQITNAYIHSRTQYARKQIDETTLPLKSRKWETKTFTKNWLWDLCAFQDVPAGPAGRPALEVQVADALQRVGAGAIAPAPAHRQTGASAIKLYLYVKNWAFNFSQVHTMTTHYKLWQQHCNVLVPKNLTPRRDSNPGSSVL
jgi:hypothetical protein